jgi:hypothetical protein
VLLLVGAGDVQLRGHISAATPCCCIAAGLDHLQAHALLLLLLLLLLGLLLWLAAVKQVEHTQV